MPSITTRLQSVAQLLYSSKIVTLCDLLFRKREAKSTVMLTIDVLAISIPVCLMQ